PVAPEEEHRYWYQYYFHAERGRRGLAANRRELCRLLWRLWSPTWAFDETNYARTAEAFDNPDFVDVVIHSYRHRFGLVEGDPAYAEIERRLEAQPDIAVPAVVLVGGDDGVDPPPSTDTAAAHFSGPYRRLVLPGVGHDVPREAPEDFAAAVLSLT
ncbi:MAG: alpha/beta hydrolase, partial [Rhizobiaceae bacterium]|nr:alpha/beta hydrolase [Rhizobiaceae bacterium]